MGKEPNVFDIGDFFEELRIRGRAIDPRTGQWVIGRRWSPGELTDMFPIYGPEQEVPSCADAHERGDEDGT